MEEMTTSPKVDFAYLLSLAQNECLPWNYLSLIVENMTLNQEQSKNMIKILLKELQQLQTKLQSKQDAVDSMKQSPLEDTPLQTVESDVASENDIESVKDISENEVSLIDPDNKQTMNELLLNDKLFAVKNHSKKATRVIDNEYYMFVGDNSEKGSENDEMPKESLEVKERFPSDDLFVKNEIPIEETKHHNSQKKHQCNICKRDFHTKQILIRHERIHSGEKPYQCKSCSKAFSRDQILKNHEKIHSGEKPFQCKTCSKTFTLPTHLNYHEKNHSGEKPFKCTTCPKSFISRSGLKEHERTHTGERPFECKNCVKSFAHRATLRNHEKYHSGEKPFQCQNCSKRFTLKCDLKRHEKVHNK